MSKGSKRAKLKLTFWSVSVQASYCLTCLVSGSNVKPFESSALLSPLRTKISKSLTAARRGLILVLSPSKVNWFHLRVFSFLSNISPSTSSSKLFKKVVLFYPAKTKAVLLVEQLEWSLLAVNKFGSYVHLFFTVSRTRALLQTLPEWMPPVTST